MNKKLENEIGTALCYLLRHGAVKENVAIDDRGFCYIDDVIAWSAGQRFGPLTLEQIDLVVANCNKQRYEIEEDRIRCVQGHSIDIIAPPISTYEGPVYHGTATRFLHAIMNTGLNGQQRSFVHLTKDKETARDVGARHGTPVILEIDRAAFSEKNPLLEASNGVLLAKYIDSKYLRMVK